MRDPKADREAANAAITTAAELIGAEMETIEAFLTECRRMESVGPILDPTLYKNSERRATEAVLKLLYEAARTFHAAYTAQIAAARKALETVHG